MTPGSTRVYAPVLRSPLLFHQNAALSDPTYYAARPATASAATRSNFTRTSSPYTHQAQYPVQTLMPIRPQFQPSAYPAPSYSAWPGPTFPSPPGPFSSSVPNATYGATDASDGLALILIATLILVALDLVIVRPQKRFSLYP
ncbi:MAG: hypothetical protein P4L49_02275 [Desulfosporosinus sp.]|nr:hypothetical protein [Desulfosporosinus sp.]